MTININNRTYVGMSNLVLRRLADGLVMNWPKPSTFQLSTGIEQKVQETRNEQGRKVRSRSYVTGEMPELSISYNYMQPEMIGFQVGNRMASGTFATSIPKLLRVTQGTYPAAAIGYLLKGVLANPVGAFGSVTRLGLSTALTYQNGLTTGNFADHATWKGTVMDAFGIGADGALVFSDNLVDLEEVVSLLIPYTATGIALSDLLIGDHSVSALLVNTENKITIFQGYTATPNLDGSSIDPSAESMDIKLFLNNPPGQCRAWQMIETDYKVACL